MKKTIARLVAIIFAAFMSLAMFAACNTDDIEDASDRSLNTFHSASEPTVLTLATFNFHEGVIHGLVADFNASNSDCYIEVVDYSQFNASDKDYSIGISRLLSDIVAGNPPDILDVSGLPVKGYATRGLFADLYPFIDADTGIDRDDFTEGVLKVVEIEGCLYYVFRDFVIKTMVGHPSIIGLNPGWNMDEFKNVLAAHPEAEMPLGSWLTQMSFLQLAVTYEIDKYINWGTNSSHFDSQEFIRLLELAATFPSGEKKDNEVGETDAIATGRQIITYATLNGFPSIQYYKALFGGEIVFKGFPNDNRNGNSINFGFGLAITENSANKEAAWLFLQSILNKDWQLNGHRYWGFPTNQAAFDKKSQDAFSESYGKDIFPDIPVESLTQADINQVKALIKATSSSTNWSDIEVICNIIKDDAQSYFSGINSAHEVSVKIQSRVSILLSERR